MRYLSYALVSAFSCLVVGCLGCSPAKSAQVGVDAEGWKRIRARIAKEFPTVPSVDTAQVAAELSGGGAVPLLLDVRERREFDVSHLPGAVLASGSELLAAVRGQAKDRRIVVYCSVGYRSAQAVQKLHDAGYKNAVNYLGSIFDWANRGHEVASANGPVHRVHGYDAEWELLLRPEFRHTRAK